MTQLLTKQRSFVRDAILSIEAYSLEERSGRDKNNQNESPFDFPAELKRLVLERVEARGWNRYPEFETARLRGAIAEELGRCGVSYPVEGILAGNGSNELLLTTLATFVTPGSRVVFPVPTFPLYEKLIGIFGGVGVPVTIDPRSGLLPVDGLIAAATATEDPAVIVVCSPNNPTGSALTTGEFDRLLATGAFVLLDRAYGEFGSAGFPAQHDRLVTFSTFSKAWGLAALRIGWLASSPQNAREIRKVKLPYNLNIFSEEAALVALDHRGLKEERVELVLRERRRLFAAMKRIDGVEPFPSEANFIAFHAAGGGAKLFHQLLERGILIRNISSYTAMENCLRVSVGTVEENDRFLAALEQCIAVAHQSSTAEGTRV